MLSSSARGPLRDDRSERPLRYVADRVSRPNDVVQFTTKPRGAPHPSGTSRVVSLGPGKKPCRVHARGFAGWDEDWLPAIPRPSDETSPSNAGSVQSQHCCRRSLRMHGFFALSDQADLSLSPSERAEGSFHEPGHLLSVAPCLRAGRRISWRDRVPNLQAPTGVCRTARGGPAALRYRLRRPLGQCTRASYGPSHSSSNVSANALGPPCQAGQDRPSKFFHTVGILQRL